MVLTTVGYGEKVPHTWAGQVIHTLAAGQVSCAFFCIPAGYHELTLFAFMRVAWIFGSLDI